MTGSKSPGKISAILPSGPNLSSAIACSRNATANVVTSIVAGAARRKRAEHRESMSSESAITTPKHVTTLAHSGQPRSLVIAIENAPAMISCP